MKKSLMQKRNKNIAAAIAAVAVIFKKFRKIGQEMEILQPHEQQEMRTGQRMMNATDKWRRRDRLNLKKKQQTKNQQQSQSQQSQMQKDRKVNENQTQGRSEQKNLISLIHHDSNTWINLNIDYNHKSPQQSTSLHFQQLSQQPTLDETLAILRTISSGDPRGYKEKELEQKQPKHQQYVGLMDVVEKSHEIMKSITEEEKKKPKVILPGQSKTQGEYAFAYVPFKQIPLFF
ncbi:MAG: hypothetical protein EZS28_052563 [Streblomastix strix]|uniref:Uncharacterized protein n=1 Tax=Streblomastix strix TaxID=222440 RepID=A0A5J4S4A5_9EUKA|nr:MAG: hypothetical protein EZS28_052563 [Streblomastix strix]